MQLPVESESVLKEMLTLSQDAWTKAILKHRMNTDLERFLLRIQLRTSRLLMSLSLATRDLEDVASIHREAQRRLISLGSET